MGIGAWALALGVGIFILGFIWNVRQLDREEKLQKLRDTDRKQWQLSQVEACLPRIAIFMGETSLSEACESAAREAGIALIAKGRKYSEFGLNSNLFCS